MKLNETLKLMVERSGVSVTDETIKKILDNPAFASIEVDEEVSKKLTAPLFTMDAAKNNPELHNHFKATILNGLDKKVYDSATEFGLSEEEIADLKKETSSYERAIILSKKVQALTEKKSGAGSKDKDTLSQEIEKLNGEIKSLKDGFTVKEKQLADSFEGERLGWKTESIHAEFLPLMDKTKSVNVNKGLIKMLIADEIASKGLKLINKDGNPSLVTKEDTDYFENNVKVDYKTFVNKKLANEKLLSASQKTDKKNDKTDNSPAPGENKTGLKTDKFMAALTE